MVGKIHIALFSFGFLLALGATSCVKDVIMDAKEKPQVSVVCILTDDPVQELRISFTKGASLSVAPPLTEAEASLTDLTRGEVMKFERQQDGVWRTDFAAKPGHRYRIDVSVPGYDPIWAEDRMPEKLRFYLQHVYWLANFVKSPTGYKRIDPGGNNPDPLFDFWIWKDGDDLPKGETYFGVAALQNPVWIYALNYNPATGRRELADEICTEYEGVDNFNLTGKIYDPPQWEEPIPYTVKPAYSAFLSDTHTKALYPFLKGSPMHKYFLRIIPREIEMSPVFRPVAFGVSGNFYGKYNCPDFFQSVEYVSFDPVEDVNSHRGYGYVHDVALDEGYVVCAAVSDVFDTFLKEAWKMQEIDASTDLSTIYLRDNVYTNIQGGAVGIFGCKVERKFQWSGEGTYIDYDRSAESVSFQGFADGHGFYMPTEERKEVLGY